MTDLMFDFDEYLIILLQIRQEIYIPLSTTTSHLTEV